MFFNRLALLGAVPIFLALAAIGFLAFRFATTETAEQAWVAHSYEVHDSIETIMSDVERAEAAQRGFLLSRDDLFLASYKIARAAIIPDLVRFKSLTRDNPIQQARAVDIEKLVRRRFATLEQLLAVGAAPDLYSPSSMKLLANGRSEMDALRAQIAAALGEENALLRKRVAATAADERDTLMTAGLGAAFVFLILMAAAALIVRNNAELERSQVAIAHQAQLLQATLDSIMDGLAVFDTNGTLIAFNLNFFHLLEFPPTLARLGMKLDEFKRIDGVRGGTGFIRLLEGDPDMGVRRATIGDRELDLYRAIVPNDGFLIVAADVSARVRSEAALRQAQKMEAVGQLTGGIAHDFNNLLQVIGANLDLIAPELRASPQSASRLQNAVSAIQRASRLTTQLLAFARRQALEPRALNPGRLILDMTDLLRRTLGEHIEVEAAIAGGLWNTLADANQLQNAMLNLAVNARDAMPNGGKLTIEVANAFLDDEYAERHSEVVPGQYVLIAVSDTGHGMSPDVIARVFDPFFTTKPEGRGTGLGLSQVYGFVKQSGGHVKIYSELGQGTTVKLYLPRTAKAQEAVGSAINNPVVGGSETILVVEDDESVRDAVCEMLVELGYRVLNAEHAEQALDILKGGAKVDLMFTDVVMPGPINTRDLARRAREILPDMKILYTSGYTQNAIVHNGRLDSDVFLLSKPYRKDELARKLRSLLQESGAAAETPPIVREELAAPSKTPTEAALAALKKALVVEDVALIRMTTLDMLAEIGLETAEAADGKTALDILANDAKIGVLIADLGLPGMSGKELVEEVRRRRPDLKIVIASGATTDEKPADDPGIAFLSKPFDLDQLRRAILEG